MFDEQFYLETYPDVAEAISNGSLTSPSSISPALYHYIYYGAEEGRQANPENSYMEKYYLDTNLDVARAVNAGGFASGFHHYFLHGEAEGRPASPQPIFDAAYYLAANPDASAAVSSGAITAGEHYLSIGLPKGAAPDESYFDETYYLMANPDVRDAVMTGALSSGRQHYDLYGQGEGRAPSGPFFNETFYRDQNPDVAAAVDAGAFSSGFEHYKLFGRAEGREAAFDGGVLDFTGAVPRDERLAGHAGEDLLLGGPGTDLLSGLHGADTLNGGAGSDILAGGTLVDDLTGGSEADTFVFHTVEDMRFGDVIRDFNAAEGDRIDLSSLAQGGAPVQFIGGALFTENAGVTQVRYAPSETAPNNSFVYVNSDADTDPEGFFALIGVTTLTGDEFMLA